MFSFFKKKTPEVSPSEEVPIPGADSNPQGSNGDEFIFVDRRAPPPPVPGNNLYPMMPPGYPPMPNIPAPKPAPILSYLHGVPFELSAEICSENSFETQQTQVDHILATITRTMSIDESQDYNFALEREIISQCE